MSSWWSGAALKDLHLSDEQLAARGLSVADPEIKKRFGRGTQYNLKVVIRGDIGTGKTCLVKRLRGGGFLEEYTASSEISTAKIAWKAKTDPDDVVVLELWDVVDKARKKPVELDGQLSLAHRTRGVGKDGQPIREADGKHTVLPLDASLIDVYNGAHCVLFVLDPSKPWTYDYVKRELERVPLHIPCAVLVGFRDYAAQRRAITLQQVETDLVNPPFTDRTFRTWAFETSMLNCFGLHALHEFLHVPFLAHKRAELETALRLNTESMGKVQKQLVTAKQNTFEDFVAAFEARRQRAAKKAEQNRLDAIRQAELQKQAEEAARLAALGGAAAIPGASAVYSMGESVSSWLGAAAPQGSYAGSVLSYLGGAVAPLVGGLASAKQPEVKQTAAILDDFYGGARPPEHQQPEQQWGARGAQAPPAAASLAAAAKPAGASGRPWMRSADWDDDDTEPEPLPIPQVRPQAPALPRVALAPTTVANITITGGGGGPASSSGAVSPTYGDGGGYEPLSGSSGQPSSRGAGKAPAGAAAYAGDGGRGAGAPSKGKKSRKEKSKKKAAAAPAKEGKRQKDWDESSSEGSSDGSSSGSD